ncbi:NCS2 family permease [Verrucomicrobium sp. BvORR106]|uniref:NCS2 family permease n=1 Tax=Verrucomicrobium sp. BvORR106 TaxID=1403819 RepID=UPI00224104CF|nr:NCS2 family permease [Verrucomicrobium sp. BvORR106]
MRLFSIGNITKGDLDGFFGLFIDNLLQLLLIFTLCPLFCGMSHAEVTTKVLPGAAISILVGNIFFAVQAWLLAKKENRSDVTAMPYGINTVSLIAYIVFIMAPVYRQTQDASLAWKAGLLACLVSGLMELVAALFGGWLRQHTPRAALLSTLAGIAITFIAMGFVFQAFANPAIGLLPLLIIILGYAGKVKLPLGLPAGFVAVVIGTVLAWILRGFGVLPMPLPAEGGALGFHPPLWYGGELYEFLITPVGWGYLSVIIPMGLFNIIGSLQCLESAEAAGDRYSTTTSLCANGVGSIIAACLGSPFATTLYIGHPGWKAMGARWSYSWLNGVVICAIALFGAVGDVLRFVPLEVSLGILLWIGLVITAQAFQASPSHHAVAVAAGLAPSMAAWLLVQIQETLRVAGKTLYDTVDLFGSALHVRGVIALSQGFIVTSIVYSAVIAFVIDRKYREAAAWMLAAAILSAIGLMHAYKLTPNGVENQFGWFAAPEFAIVYAVAAGLLWLLARRPQTTTGFVAVTGPDNKIRITARSN